MSDVGEKPDDKSKAKVYPAQAVYDSLLAELTQLAEADLRLAGAPLPSTPGEMLTVKVRLDSLTVVDVTLELEPILGFEPKDIVRTGGYDSIKAGLDHMLPKLEAAWHRKNPAVA